MEATSRYGACDAGDAPVVIRRRPSPRTLLIVGVAAVAAVAGASQFARRRATSSAALDSQHRRHHARERGVSGVLSGPSAIQGSGVGGLLGGAPSTDAGVGGALGGVGAVEGSSSSGGGGGHSGSHHSSHSHSSSDDDDGDDGAAAVGATTTSATSAADDDDDDGGRGGAASNDDGSSPYESGGDGALGATGTATTVGSDDDDAGLVGNWSAAFNGTSKNVGTSDHSRCKVFKRTMASTHAEADAAWLVSNVGMKVALNETYKTHKEPCASRELLSTLGGWSMHYFTSHVTEEGDIPVSEWVGEWTGQHDATFADGVWNAWMAQSVTFYTPYLTPFVERWEETGAKWLGRRYTSHLDGVQLYAAYVSTPHSGHVVEIVSESLHSKYARTFDHLTDDTCPDAVRVNRTVADMTMYWEIMGGEETNEDTGLPDVLIVQMTMPSDNVWSLPRYLREYVATELPISAVVVGGDSPCEFTVAHLPKCGEEVDGDVFEAQCSDEMLWNVDVKARGARARGGAIGGATGASGRVTLAVSLSISPAARAQPQRAPRQPHRRRV